MLEICYDVFMDALLDCVKMLPFLFVAFLLLEFLEHHAQEKVEKVLSKVKYGGPLVGALLGCIPQCGFSVIAAGLYGGGTITMGTLIAVFISTSDEAVLIMLGHPEAGRMMASLIGIKIVIAIAAGYIVDIAGRNYRLVRHNVDQICVNCGCHDDHGIVKPALRHTVRIFGFLFLFSLILGGILELGGSEVLASFLLKDSIFQPFLAALIGLIPNCAASVLLTELYLNQMISFASLIAGLCAGAGLGLPVLCKINHHKAENVKMIGLLYAFAVAAGLVLSLLF